MVNYEVIIRPEAQEDIKKIILWYEQLELGLGDYFILCLDASIEGMTRFPTAPRKVHGEYRRFFVRKFPVGVFYIVDGDRIHLDVVEPLMRDPSRLGQRLGK